MYNGWISDRSAIENECGVESVLNNFSPGVGRDVTVSIIKSLVHQKSASKELFNSEKDLEWTMDVICFGLTMPLTDMELETIKNCVYLYLDWFSVFSSKPKPGIPCQIVQNKEYYFAIMLKHLTNIFIPRESSTTNYQNNFCSRILFDIKNLVQEGNLSKSTSEDVLRFFLGISGRLLSQPPMKGGLADMLCEQLINSLITVWIHISCYFFPSPTLWCTLQEELLTWRHNHILIIQWNKLTYVLTCKVLSILFGPSYPLPTLYKSDTTEPINLPGNMSDDIAVQCWFRFLHCIGNPVDLTYKARIANTSHFAIYGLEHNQEPSAHPSLKSLPQSFLKAMQGISVLVKMFLGAASKKNRSSSIVSQSFRGELKSSNLGPSETKAATVPGVRRIADHSSISTKTVRDDSNITPKTLNAIATDANCILHLFGSWLFDVCLSGVDLPKVLTSVGIISSGGKPTSYNLTKEDIDAGRSLPPVVKNNFEPGRAEAFSTLCQIFCHQNVAGQAILPVYLSRFYLALSVGLCYGETKAGQVLGEILLNITDILRIDLHGVQVLIPNILQSIELILPSTDITLGYDFSLVMLRRSCIHILLSMLCLPLHFLQLPIQGLCKERVTSLDMGYTSQLNFISLKGRLTEILKKALEAEIDSENTQLLFAGAMLLMEDTMFVESRNDEYIKSNPGSAVPCILLENVDDAGKGSPKLLHIAKTNPIKPISSNDIQKQKSDKGSKSEIGRLGKANDTNTTKGMFVYMTKFLCQGLMFAEKWRGDLNITLAALECMSGMANFDSKFIDEDAAKATLSWICNYIEFQAKKPPPSHNKNLHSIIVAAFHCINLWLISHPWLVDDKFCLDAVLEVTELGISGSKSKSPQDTQDTQSLNKGEKELKSVSMRVRDAAESLLALLMEQLDIFPNPCGPSTVSTLLDEEALLQHCKTDKRNKFRYFASDGTTVIGLLEDSVTEPKELSPSAIAVLRGPSGKKVCSITLQQFPRNNRQEMVENCQRLAPLPLAAKDIPDAPPVSQQHFPLEVERVEKTRADSSIPELGKILNERQKEEFSLVENLMKLQEEAEKDSIKEEEHESRTHKDDVSPQKPPHPTGKNHATRLFLSHLGLLSPENLQYEQEHQVQGLVTLRSMDENFSRSLQSLDSFPTRTFDTIFVFFVRKGQHRAKDIINNEIPTLDNHLFTEFLHSLGWPVQTNQHNGWNGDLATSWKLKERLTDEQQQQQPNKKFFYYADLMTELAIHVPSLNLKKKPTTTTTTTPEKTPPQKSNSSSTESSSVQQQQPEDLTDGFHHHHHHHHHHQRASSSERKLRKQTTVESPPTTTTSHDVRHRIHNSQSETKILIAWLQDVNDHQHFPARDLVELNATPQESSYSSSSSGHHHHQTSFSGRVPEREIVVIYIHPLKTGLFRIMVATVFGSSIGGPLVDGMVCSRRVLGSMVRTTAINICRRRRLEIDSYSPPHVCRKLRIQELIRKHTIKQSVPEFYASLI